MKLIVILSKFRPLNKTKLKLISVFGSSQLVNKRHKRLQQMNIPERYLNKLSNYKDVRKNTTQFTFTENHKIIMFCLMIKVFFFNIVNRMARS